MGSFRRDSDGVYRLAEFQRWPWLIHGFGTRFSSGWNTNPRFAILRQVHSNRVVKVGKSHGCLGEGDALVTAEPEVRLAVRTADCLPVLIADPQQRVIAAIHAGWRGTAAAIARETIRVMEQEFAVSPENLHAAIGPAIGACCYEVGPDVARLFAPWIEGYETASGATKLDLAGINRRQLIEAGLPDRQIYGANLCTHCIDAEFHSYRREGAVAGRMISAIEMRHDGA